MASLTHLVGSMPQRARHFLAFVAAAVFVIIFYYTIDTDFAASYRTSRTHDATQAPTSQKLYGTEYKGRSSPTELNRVTNNSLGFSKVLVVGLPERTDKRDALALTSALTGFHVDWVDGVRGETIPDKALPIGIDRLQLMETNLGSWRGHMNAIRRIVDEDLESALIMEDDMDWDVRLRSQLEDIAKGSRMVLGDEAKSPSSPYGDGWDLLWLGHCGEPFPETLEENRDKPHDHPGIRYMKTRYAIENDPTVPPPERTTGLIDFYAHPHTRFVHVTASPICSFAYALSQAGARKVLFDLSVDHLTGAFDNALSGLCRRAVASVGEENPGGDRGLDARCISVTPPVFFHHRAKGWVFGDSDIQNINSAEFREKGMSENIVWSARNNIRNMIAGTEMESQL